MYKISLLSLSVAILAGCNSGASTSLIEDNSQLSRQQQLNAFADTLDVDIEIIANKSGNCTLAGKTLEEELNSKAACMEATWTLIPKTEYVGNDWSIYFSQTDTVKYPLGENFDIEYINGDLHRLYPKKEFSGFVADQPIKFHMIGKGYVVTEAEFMPNMYIAEEGLSPVIIKDTQVKPDADTGLETRSFARDLSNYAATFKRGDSDQTILATSSHLFDKYKNNADKPEWVKQGIVPTPKSVAVLSKGLVDLNKGINLHINQFEGPSLVKAFERLDFLGVKKSKNGIPVVISQLETNPVNQEGYELIINDNGIGISAWSETGAFYGVMSLASLINIDNLTIPKLLVRDEPRFEYRGMHVDVSRNFRSKQFVLDLLDQMAAYKLNKLHLQVGDDEGWRLEIKDLPELTDIGSRRCHDMTESTCLLPQLGGGPLGNSDNDGYYSIEDYIEIIRAANARHIQVIPSFDMPGHSRAVVKAMEARYRHYFAQGDVDKANEYLLSDFDDTTEYRSIQNYNDNTINVCMESTYHFLDKLIDELIDVHKTAGQPLTQYHLGADETAGAWKESPVCKAFLANNQYGVREVKGLGPYFIERFSQLLEAKGVQVAGWSDGLGHTNVENMPSFVQS
ncbi:MAG: carbohydate-binding domain-containing protein, partial [Lentisphaeria bacterium]|nr:carbohydate-binding domain-containing protein [Lentisphaeria bacterium]